MTNDEGCRRRDVRAVMLLGVKKGEEGPFGREKREMAGGGGAGSFCTRSNPLAIELISFRHGLARSGVRERMRIRRNKDREAAQWE